MRTVPWDWLMTLDTRQDEHQGAGWLGRSGKERNAVYKGTGFETAFFVQNHLSFSVR